MECPAMTTTPVSELIRKVLKTIEDVADLFHQARAGGKDLNDVLVLNGCEQVLYRWVQRRSRRTAAIHRIAERRLPENRFRKTKAQRGEELQRTVARQTFLKDGKGAADLAGQQFECGRLCRHKLQRTGEPANGSLLCSAALSSLNDMPVKGSQESPKAKMSDRNAGLPYFANPARMLVRQSTRRLPLITPGTAALRC